jgi:MFS family permease
MRVKSLLVNRSILVIIAEGFLSRLSFGIVSFALPLYARQLGLSLVEIGLLISLSAVAEQALKPLAGFIADRFGLKFSYVSAIGLRSVVALLLIFATLSWQLYAIRILHGISESLRDPSVNALIADRGNHKTLASSFAWYATAKTIAGSVGKALTGVLLAASAYGYAEVFTAAFCLSILPLFVVVRYVRNQPDQESPEAEAQAFTEPLAGSPPVEPQVGNPGGILPFAILGFLIAATANMLHNLFPVLAVEYAGLSVAETGLIYTLTIPVVIISGPLFGWLSDNVSRNLVLMVRGTANIFSSIFYVAFPSFLGIASGKLMDDMGKAAFRPAWGALMSQVSGFNKKRRARTIGYLSFGEGLGEIVGPILAGFLWNAWGITVVVAARVLLALVSEAYAVILMRRLPNKGWNNPPGGDRFKPSTHTSKGDGSERGSSLTDHPADSVVARNQD